MIVGVLLGNIQHFTPWIFMATAGVFMYVALVDMMPGEKTYHFGTFFGDEILLLNFRAELRACSPVYFEGAKRGSITRVHFPNTRTSLWHFSHVGHSALRG